MGRTGHQLGGQLPQAILISRTASLPILLIALGAFGGVLAFGFIGIFLGPVLLALGQMLLTRWLREETSQ